MKKAVTPEDKELLLTGTHIQKLREDVLHFLEGESIKVFFFGSRARGDSSYRSDVDIGVMPGKGFDRKKLILLREFIEDLNIPYKIDVVDMSEVSDEFRNEVMKDAVVWKE